MDHIDAKRARLRKQEAQLNRAALTLAVLMVLYCGLLTWIVWTTPAVEPIATKTVTQRTFWAGDHFEPAIETSWK